MAKRPCFIWGICGLEDAQQYKAPEKRINKHLWIEINLLACVRSEWHTCTVMATTVSYYEVYSAHV